MGPRTNCTNLQTLNKEGLERLRSRQDYSCHTESSWKQASSHVTLNLLRDWVTACCGLRIKTFPKMEKLWTEIPVLFNYLLVSLAWAASLIICSAFFFVICRQTGGHYARRSLWRLSKLGLEIVAWSKPRMFCEESLGKIKLRAFPKRVGPRILSLESVDYFGTSKHYWVVEKKKNKNLNKQNYDDRVL